MSEQLQALYDKLVQARQAVTEADKAVQTAREAMMSTPEYAEITRLQDELAAARSKLMQTKEAGAETEAAAAAGEAVVADRDADLALRAAAIAHYNATKEKSPIKGVSVQVRKRTFEIGVPEAEYISWAQKSLPSAVETTINQKKVETAILGDIVKRPDWLTIVEHPTASITLPK